MNRKLKLFKRLGTLKKRDIVKDQFQSGLISKEIDKTKDLIEKIDLIISENSSSTKDTYLSAAFLRIIVIY